MVEEAAIRLRFETLDPVLDERSRRRFAAAEACPAGRGGIASISRITGIAHSTINRGLAELGTAASVGLGARASSRRRRKNLTAADATLPSDLQDLVEPTTLGDPWAPLLWTSRILRNLAAALARDGPPRRAQRGRRSAATAVLQSASSRMTREGSDSPNRDDRRRYGDHNGPRIIRIVGGLPEPANATIDGQRIDITEGDSVEVFERWAVELGYETGADFVILVGCDAEGYLPNTSR